jgi:hypothetical protein
MTATAPKTTVHERLKADPRFREVSTGKAIMVVGALPPRPSQRVDATPLFEDDGRT